MNRRKTKQNWIDAGLTSLKSKGPTAISVKKLSQTLGVTRGSFYHHFTNIQAFNSAILDYWININTTVPFAEAKSNTTTPAEELKELVERVLHTDKELEVAVLTWASTNDQVKACVEAQNTFRLDSITTLYQAVVGDNEKGKRFAQIAFYGFLGAIHAQPSIEEEQLGELITSIQELLLNSL